MPQFKELAFIRDERRDIHIYKPVVLTGSPVRDGNVKINFLMEPSGLSVYSGHSLKRTQSFYWKSLNCH